ncbi:hypothetical protein [Janthinobacterium sp. LB2P70]|uniref:hypothetical protein n=1 Tax=Janthinobacterium sp. LB2P70 TaxID=3424197 RepID=UPI003F289552
MKNNSFRPLATYLRTQLATPLGQFSFWTYLLIAVWGIGGLGIWVELIKHARGAGNSEGILTAIYTYFPAVAVGSSMQLIIKEDEKRHVRSFASLIGSALILIAVLQGLELTGEYPYVWGVIGILIATFLWWVANGGDENLHDNINPADSLGDNPHKPPAGSSNGFAV